jgi:undecaprenyldiphospho-muramoylpentapeptide beta-N-acetylglucosaminyltransferase
VYPALAVLQTVKDKLSDLLWVGGEGGMEAELVRRQGIVFRTIPAAGVHGVGLKQLPNNLGLLTRGLLAARRILRDFHPDALFFTGGYTAVPMALAGWRLPTLLYAPDIEPGLALKSVARLADCIALTAEDSREYFPAHSKLTVTGYPVRADLTGWKCSAARQKLGLLEALPVLLVLGGSRGARSINQALGANLPALLKKAQVVHLSGELDWPAVEATRRELTEQQAVHYHAFPYLHEQMGAALAAADLVVSRAGASTLGEYPMFSLPAILVPYPHAWRYQKVNADYLAQRGAAVVIRDNSLQDELLPTVTALLENPTKLQAMRSAMQSLARPQAATAIADQLLKLTGEN